MFVPQLFADIALDTPLYRTFTYSVPDELADSLAVGARVVVNLGRQKIVGVCLAVMAKLPPDFPEEIKGKIRPLLEILDVDHPSFDSATLAWLNSAADYYCAPIGQVLAQALPSHYWQLPKKKRKYHKETVLTGSENILGELSTLTAEQKIIRDSIARKTGAFSVALIHGITGSGKTEIYLSLIGDVISRGMSALYLVPEIGLTPQTLRRVESAFPGATLVFHSGMTDRQRADSFAKARESSHVLIGTRSAIFAPMHKLGIIVIDEEHDASYKQDDRFRYHARDMAILRGRLARIPVVMGSATPSLEVYAQTQSGKYDYYELKNRFGAALPPRIDIIDIMREKQQTGSALVLSRHIHDAINACRARKKQCIIFVGQRGYAQNATCMACGEIQMCLNCSVGLKHHKPENILKCHYCDFSLPFDEKCQKCGDKALALYGIGTQMVEEEIRSMHPRAIVERLDSDAVTTAKKLAERLEAFACGKVEILIGTQMLAKGHDFKDIGFVGVLGIDVAMGLPDFRASERCFQTLVQVAGRAGRRDTPGHVLVQSLRPDHPSIVLGAKQDYLAFANYELSCRETLSYPPFTRLVQLRLISVHEKRLADFLDAWQFFLDRLRKMSSGDQVSVLGPTEMPLAKIRGKHRFHIILKIKRGLRLRDYIDFIRDDFERRRPAGIDLQIDVDPGSLL